MPSGGINQKNWVVVSKQRLEPGNNLRVIIGKGDVVMFKAANTMISGELLPFIVTAEKL